MNEKKETQKLTIDAYRIELSDFKVLGFLPMRFRTFLSLSLNTRLSQLSYFFSKKQFISSDIAKFQYAIYKESIVTIDSIYFVLKPKSSELLEANRTDKENYLKKVSEYLSKYDENASLNAIFETTSNTFKIDEYFTNLDKNLSSQKYVNEEWIKSASKIKDLITQDIEKQTLAITESNSYFILSIALFSHQDDKIDEAYKKLITAKNKIIENLLLESLTSQELHDYAVNHYVEHAIDKIKTTEVIKTI